MHFFSDEKHAAQDFDEFQSLMRKKAGLAAGEVCLRDLFCLTRPRSSPCRRWQVSGGELRTLFAAMDLDENGSVSL